MNWRERTAQILQKGARDELTKPTKALSPPLLSVLSVPPLAHSGEKGELPPDVDARRQKVIAMLAAHPEASYAVLTDSESDPGAVIVVVAIRERATCELHIPRDKYDGLLLLDLIERHGATLH